MYEHNMRFRKRIEQIDLETDRVLKEFESVTKAALDVWEHHPSPIFSR
jgi:hypothetical protein